MQLCSESINKSFDQSQKEYKILRLIDTTDEKAVAIEIIEKDPYLKNQLISIFSSIKTKRTTITGNIITFYFSNISIANAFRSVWKN